MKMVIRYDGICHCFAACSEPIAYEAVLNILFDAALFWGTNKSDICLDSTGEFACVKKNSD